MIPVYEKEYDIGPGLADSTGKLGIYETFRLFMDMAAKHAELIGVGLYDLGERSLFWLTSKTKAVFDERPPIGSRVLLRTCPETPERIRGNRSYEVEWNGRVVIRGKSEWVVTDTSTKRLVPMKTVYPEGIVFGETSCPEPYCRIEAPEGEPYCRFRVSSSDIDVGGHMNNTAYVRAVLGSFTTEELASLAPRTVDVAFRVSCFEGDTLELRRSFDGDGVSVSVSRGDEAVLLMRLAK